MKVVRSSSAGEADSGLCISPPATDDVAKKDDKPLPRILMVEDNKMNQKVQARMLKLIDLDCDIAENGRIGVDMFLARNTSGKPYDLILMDFHMPEMDGREAACVIRSHELQNSLNHCHIVGLTAEGASEADGICTVITKPIKKASFHKIIPKYLHDKPVNNCFETTKQRVNK